MQNLIFRYTRHFNRRHDRTGHLFQGRFASILVDEEAYLLSLVRYIHLNPVRAGLVQDPSQWAWSGHQRYLGEAPPGFLDTQWVLGRFSASLPQARKSYKKFVLQGILCPEPYSLSAGDSDPRILGDETFSARFQMQGALVPPKKHTLDDITDATCLVFKLSEQDLSSPGAGHRQGAARAVVALLAQESANATLTEVASRFGRDVSTVSAQLRRLRERLRNGGEESAVIEAVRARLRGGTAKDQA